MYTKESLPRFAKSLRDAATNYPAIRKVLNQFDGKVYNKRFDDAIREATNKKCFASRSSYNKDHVCIYAYTLGYQTITLLEIFLPDSKRLDASALVDKANETREKLLKRAYTIEQSIENAPETIGQLQSIIDLFSQIISCLPYEFIEAYGLSNASSLKYINLSA